MTTLAQTLRGWWSAMTGQRPKPVLPEVVVHDPEAARPHDLDDPFFDPKVQARMADVIANNAKKH